MAQSPSKRRGIMLGYQDGETPSLGLPDTPPTAAVSLKPDQTPPGAERVGGDALTTLKAMADDLAALRRTHADLELRWKRQAEQLEQLERQREDMALDTHRPEAPGQSRRQSGRLGFLLALLALTAIAASGYHSWPRLQEVAGEVSRVHRSLHQLAPQLETAREQVTSLTTDIGQMGGAVASLREDVSAVRSDLGALRQTADSLPQGTGATHASATRSAALTAPRTATTMPNPYRAVYPMRPW
jgi:septal ring factor EnvC (AmiA/AmiB activator)